MTRHDLLLQALLCLRVTSVVREPTAFEFRRADHRAAIATQAPFTAGD
jgi:hypothetical protein